MKTRIPVAIIALLMALVVSAGVQAQDGTEITVKVTRDGKVVKDTTYKYDSEDEAEHMLKLMEILGDEGDRKMEYEYRVSRADGDQFTTALIVSKNGEKTEIKKISADSLLWISEVDEEGGSVKVVRKGMVLPDTLHDSHVIVTTSGDPGKKLVKVKVSEDGKGNWNVESEELTGEEKDIYIISGDESDLHIETIEKEIDGENVKVVVVKKNKEDKKQ